MRAQPRSTSTLDAAFVHRNALLLLAGAWLRDNLSLFDETLLNGKTGSRIDVTASAANNGWFAEGGIDDNP